MERAALKERGMNQATARSAMEMDPFKWRGGDGCVMVLWSCRVKQGIHHHVTTTSLSSLFKEVSCAAGGRETGDLHK